MTEVLIKYYFGTPLGTLNKRRLWTLDRSLNLKFLLYASGSRNLEAYRRTAALPVYFWSCYCQHTKIFDVEYQ